MTMLGWIGLVATGIGLVVVLLTLLLIFSNLLSLRRRVTHLQALLARENIAVGRLLLQLRQAQAERDELGRPYKRARRWLTHPITLALFGSYRRRRRAHS
jgi:chromate transport protein ChrA